MATYMNYPLGTGKGTGTTVATPNNNLIFSDGITTWGQKPYVPTNIETIINQIIREEVNLIQDLNLDKIEKMLRGTKDDILIAIELLATKTLYLWRIIHETKINSLSTSQLDYIVRDYLEKNLYNINLRKELL